ncbi:MAG: hypothetical protein H6Q04_2900 [Acidobacteria bacterium]|nr:hypothetical protein [Acidobacteriota bacterium]
MWQVGPIRRPGPTFSLIPKLRGLLGSAAISVARPALAFRQIMLLEIQYGSNLGPAGRSFSDE